MSLAAANGAFDFIDAHNLGAWVKEIGKYTRDGLRAVQERSRFIGEVRGRGLLIVTRALVDRFLERFSDALSEVEAQY